MSEITHLIFIKIQILQAGNDKSLGSYFQVLKKKEKEKVGDELTKKIKMMLPCCILEPVPSNKNAKSHYLHNLIPCSKSPSIPSTLQPSTALCRTGREIIGADFN